MENKDLIKEKINSNTEAGGQEKIADACPECGAPVHFGEGCSLCLECGFSKCG